MFLMLEFMAPGSMDCIIMIIAGKYHFRLHKKAENFNIMLAFHVFYCLKANREHI